MFNAIMRIIGVGAILLLTSLVVNAVPLKEKSPLRALYYVYSAESNDYFYSINKNDIDSAIYNYGYDDLPGRIGIVGYVEAVSSTHTSMFRRFYKWLPQTDHFYTTDNQEANQVLSWGWTDEGFEGYLYTYQVPGTVPLYRLNKYDASSGDLVHYYGTDAADLQDKIRQGFVNDGVKGYIYTNVTANAAPAITGGRILGRRCDYSKVFGGYGCNEGAPNSRDDYFNQGFNLPSIVYNASATASHYVTFDYISYDWSQKTGHQDIMLRNNVNYDPNNVTWGAFDGFGLIFSGASWWCPGTGDSFDKVVVEIWRPTADGRGTEPLVDCSTLSNARLVNGVKYSFSIKSTHDGWFCYGINQGANIVEPYRCFYVKDKYENMHNHIPEHLRKKPYNLSYPTRFVPYPIPNFSTGANTKYTLIHANDAKEDFTSYFLNINSYWWY